MYHSFKKNMLCGGWGLQGKGRKTLNSKEKISAQEYQWGPREKKKESQSVVHLEPVTVMELESDTKLNSPS